VRHGPTQQATIGAISLACARGLVRIDGPGETLHSRAWTATQKGEKTMAWILLISAGILETGFAVALKESDGFTKPIPVVIFAVCAIASFVFLNLALRDLPVGTAYAVWTGIGAAGTAAVGMIALDEPTDALRIGAIVLIITGAIGLQAVESH
jgi:quaternary ammonium compound-resistance protein SugE